MIFCLFCRITSISAIKLKTFRMGKNVLILSPSVVLCDTGIYNQIWRIFSILFVINDL